MAVVKDFYLGNAHIKIYDDYVVKTPEQVQQILKRCAEIVKADERREFLRESSEN